MNVLVPDTMPVSATAKDLDGCKLLEATALTSDALELWPRPVNVDPT